MKKKYICLGVASLITGLSLNAQTINENMSADVELGFLNKQFSSQSNDKNFSTGIVNLTLENKFTNELKVNLGFRSNQKLDQIDNYYDDTHKESSMLYDGNISYENDFVNIIVGRQWIDMEWLGYIHEAALVTLKTIPDTLVTVGYTSRISFTDEDEIGTFNKDFGDTGAYIFNTNYQGIKDTSAELFYFDAPDLFNAYGLKLDYTNSVFGLTGRYAQTNEQNLNVDGDVYHFEGRYTISDLNLKAGYLVTDKDGGSGSLRKLGGNLVPFFEEGYQIYEVDAKTAYFGADYTFNELELIALYGQTDYGNNHADELNLKFNYPLTSKLTLSPVYANINSNESSYDYDIFKTYVTYKF